MSGEYFKSSSGNRNQSSYRHGGMMVLGKGRGTSHPKTRGGVAPKPVTLGSIKSEKTEPEPPPTSPSQNSAVGGGSSWQQQRKVEEKNEEKGDQKENNKGGTRGWKQFDGGGGGDPSLAVSPLDLDSSSSWPEPSQQTKPNKAPEEPNKRKKGSNDEASAQGKNQKKATPSGDQQPTSDAKNNSTTKQDSSFSSFSIGSWADAAMQEMDYSAPLQLFPESWEGDGGKNDKKAGGSVEKNEKKGGGNVQPAPSTTKNSVDPHDKWSNLRKNGPDTTTTAATTINPTTNPPPENKWSLLQRPTSTPTSTPTPTPTPTRPRPRPTTPKPTPKPIPTQRMG